MLTELRIANFAVIDRLHLSFSSGFHVFTGETGAGKSILVDAMALLVGGRASADLIRAGAEEAEVEAAFDLHPGPAGRHFQEAGLLDEGEAELIIRRVVTRAGRNRVYLNGRLTPLHVLETLAGTLIDLHGQHAQQSLLSAPAQTEALDLFGGLTPLRLEFQRCYEDWKARRRALEGARRTQEERAQREDYLRFQCRELEEAGLQAGEEAALLAEHQRLAQVTRLRELGEEAYQTLYGGEASVLKGLSVVEARVGALADLDRDAQEWRPLCQEAAVQLRELAHRLRDYNLRLEEDPARLSFLEERLALIHRLERKYGGSFETVLARAEELKAELAELDRSGMRIAELERSVAEGAGAARAAAEALSRARRAAATRMEGRIRKELAALRMEHTRFRVVVESETELDRATTSGADRVEFLLSCNPGEPVLPLAKIVSGGELSRVMLAIKTVLAERDAVPILVFDEVDAGVGGAVAEVMGRRLNALGAHHQVFCITHLPQVASQAEHHYLVEKAVQDKRTIVRVRSLSLRGREAEIARMLGGLTITKAVRQTAAEMVSRQKEVRRLES